MIMADKIIDLRKRNGWTQEGLAARMGVSRQAISKWESAQSVPDLKNILELAQLFEVSTDYLIRDDISPEDEGLRSPILDTTSQTPETSEISAEDTPELRQVTLEEATEFLNAKNSSALPVALGVSACILSPAPLILSLGLKDAGFLSWDKGILMAVGVIVLLLMVAAGVVTFIVQNAKLSKFNYLDQEAFETAYGVSGMVKQRQAELSARRLIHIATGVALCILAPAGLIFGVFISDESNDYMGQISFPIALVLVAIAVYLFVSTETEWGATTRLLQEGEYHPEKKKSNKLLSSWIQAYWLIVLAAFLVWAVIWDAWQYAWILWAVGGILFPVYYTVLETILKSRRAGKQ